MAELAWCGIIFGFLGALALFWAWGEGWLG